MNTTQQPEALRFTKKPVTIVASQWFKSGDHPAVRDISDSDDLFFTGIGGATLVEREKFGVIGTLESPNHLVTPGDWIITGVQGEHYPCKPDIFEATYAPETKLEAQLSAIGAGGVEPLRKKAAAPQAVQAAVPEAIEQMAVDRYKVVPSHESMFHRWAVVAGNGTQQLYIGREVECLNMARKFAGAFLDGAFVAMQNAAPTKRASRWCARMC